MFLLLFLPTQENCRGGIFVWVCVRVCVCVCGRQYVKASNGRHNLRSFRLAKNLIYVRIRFNFLVEILLARQLVALAENNSNKLDTAVTLFAIDINETYVC